MWGPFVSEAEILSSDWSLLQSQVVVVFVLGQNLQVDLMKRTEEAGVILEEKVTSQWPHENYVFGNSLGKQVV